MYKEVAVILLLAAAILPMANAQTKPSANAKTAAAAVASPLKPGLWEITLLNETPGSNSKKSVVARACYSADDVKSLPTVLPKQQEFTMKCESRDVKLEGTNASWRVDCSGKGEALSGAAKLTLASTSYSGSAALQLVSGGKTSKVQQTITGKWIEACAK
jgi:hypothetical protein